MRTLWFVIPVGFVEFWLLTKYTDSKSLGNISHVTVRHKISPIGWKRKEKGFSRTLVCFKGHMPHNRINNFVKIKVMYYIIWTSNYRAIQYIRDNNWMEGKRLFADWRGMLTAARLRILLWRWQTEEKVYKVLF